MIKRNNDLIYGNEDLEFLYKHERFPAFMGCVKSSIENDILCDMSWYISKSSGMIQLNPLLPLEIVYQISHYSGSVGKLWDEHHSQFAEFILKFSPKDVLEIGGLHGTLAKKCKLTSNIDWTIIDPNPSPTLLDHKIHSIKGFFDENFIPNKNYGTIIHSHLLEHIYDVNSFLQNIQKILKKSNGKMMFSVPNMEVMLNRKYTNCLNFEHTYYISEDFIEFYLNKYSFKILQKQYFKDDHSIFYYVEHDEKIKSSKDINFYKKNKTLFLSYVNHHLNDIQKINDIISKHKGNIYLFGGHIFSQYLISYGLNINNIKYILDNDLNKQKYRLYGTNLIVESPKILKDDPNPLVILKAGVYNNEIRNDILNNINKNTLIIN
jgi:hypothetical protein